MFARWRNIAVHLTYYILMYVVGRLDNTQYIVVCSLINMGCYIISCMRIEQSRVGHINRWIEKVSVAIQRDLNKLTYVDFCKKYNIVESESEDESAK